MPNTYSQLYIQIVFAVEGRQNLILPEHKVELHKYMTGIVTNSGNKLIAIHCMPDHVHILVGLRPVSAIAELVGEIKTSSTHFINRNKWVKGRFSWQEGYGAFSYSHSHLGAVIRYIENQVEHHARQTFQSEYEKLLRRFNITFEQRFLFEFYS